MDSGEVKMRYGCGRRHPVRAGTNAIPAREWCAPAPGRPVRRRRPPHPEPFGASARRSRATRHGIPLVHLARNIHRLYNRRTDPRTMGCRRVLLLIGVVQQHRCAGRVVDRVQAWQLTLVLRDRGSCCWASQARSGVRARRTGVGSWQARRRLKSVCAGLARTVRQQKD
jgi:hypothetical protein